MKRFLLLPLLIAAFLFSGCLRVIIYPVLGEDEHAVISVVIDSVLQYEYNNKVYNITTDWVNPTAIRSSLENDSIYVDTSLFARYETVNKIRRSLLASALPDSVNLKAPTLRYPFDDSCLDFSTPVISDDGLTAIVEYGVVSAPLCGFGSGFLLKKQNGIWKIVWRKGIWIS